jgi:hypothetical protein
MKNTRAVLTVAAAAVALIAAPLIAAPAQAAVTGEPEIVRVFKFRATFVSWQIKDIPAMECSDTHPFLVKDNLTGSRPGSYYKGVEIIDPENSVWMEMDPDQASYGGGVGQYVTGVKADAGDMGNANPFSSPAIEVWLTCTNNPHKYGYQVKDGVLR